MVCGRASWCGSGKHTALYIIPGGDAESPYPNIPFPVRHSVSSPGIPPRPRLVSVGHKRWHCGGCTGSRNNPTVRRGHDRPQGTNQSETKWKGPQLTILRRIGICVMISPVHVPRVKNLKLCQGYYRDIKSRRRRRRAAAAFKS